MMKSIKNLAKNLTILSGALTLMVVGYLTLVPITPEGLIVNVPQGASLRAVAKNSAKSSHVPAILLELTGRLMRLTAHQPLKAGRYTLVDSHTAFGFWLALNQQTPEMIELTLLEGWTFKQIQQEINQHPDLKHDTAGLDLPGLMQRLNLPDYLSPEGRFFPDTYQLSVGSSDVAAYKAAFERMRKISQAVWAMKPPDTPLQSVDDLINLAAIIEKETAASSDRALVASVFHNRLKLGMRLQTDPTVIYGMGAAYQGKLHKTDLLTDTPYNTYTRNGLPPTPIAAPSEASLRAAINPPATDFLYFVAKGDGSKRSQFSSTLEQHNRAVAAYWAGR